MDMRIRMRGDVGAFLVPVDDTMCEYGREGELALRRTARVPDSTSRPRACSPKPNPDEQARNNAKREIGKPKRLNRTMREKAVLGIMRSFQNKNGLVRSFFQLSSACYILDTMN